LHRVAEEVRGLFPDVDALIANVKKFFVKCNSRTNLFKQTLNIPLPPQPIITRWGTWLSAAIYYSDYFVLIKDFITNKLNPRDAISIKKAQELITKNNIAEELLCITNNFRCLPQTITKLETTGISLRDTFEIFNNITTTLKQLQDIRLQSIRTKITVILEKNSGLQQMKQVLAKLQGQDIQQLSITPDDLKCFQYAPLVTCDVERSFSRYKNIFRDNRHSFTFEHLKMILIIACNQIVTK